LNRRRFLSKPRRAAKEYNGRRMNGYGDRDPYRFNETKFAMEIIPTTMNPIMNTFLR
jgi:hypothetical protein